MKPGKVWYLLALVPLALGIGLSVFFAFRLAGEVEAMQRVVAPGQGQVRLEAGDHVAYFETDSVHEGVAYHTTTFRMTCTVTDETGAVVPAEASSTTTSYSYGSYAGKSAFDFTTPRAGTYTIACEGEGGPATVAVGTGVGGGIVGMALSGFGGLALAVVVFFLVRRRRKRG